GRRQRWCCLQGQDHRRLGHRSNGILRGTGQLFSRKRGLRQLRNILLQPDADQLVCGQRRSGTRSHVRRRVAPPAGGWLQRTVLRHGHATPAGWRCAAELERGAEWLPYRYRRTNPISDAGREPGADTDGYALRPARRHRLPWPAGRLLDLGELLPGSNAGILTAVRQATAVEELGRRAAA